MLFLSVVRMAVFSHIGRVLVKRESLFCAIDVAKNIFAKYAILMGMHTREKLLSVFCVHSLADAPGRAHFAGILEYSLGASDWNLEVVSPKRLTPSVARRILRAADGLIVTSPAADESMRQIVDAALPVVMTNVGGYRLKPGRRQISFVWTDNDAIGQSGARHLLACGNSRCYAFVSADRPQFWEEERFRSFRAAIRAAGEDCVRFACPGGVYLDALLSWLQSIPKPAAIMASHDRLAEKVIQACRRLRLSVPEQVAVLGVDNVSAGAPRGDAATPISSIAIDFREMGRVAAIELDALIRNPRRKGASELMVPAGLVVPRRSTARRPRSEALVAAINKSLAEHAFEPLRVVDLMKGFGCSRRLAELRFRQAEGLSIRQKLEKLRCEKAMQLLSEGTIPRKRLARLCGFPSTAALSRSLKGLSDDAAGVCP